MEAVSVKIMKLADDLPLPAYHSDLAAGVDLHAAVETEVVLQPGERRLIPTGIAIALPQGYEAQVRPRSGLALKHGISMVNTPGTVDADFRGELSVILINHGHEPFTIRRGERVAQMIINKVARAQFEVIDELSVTVRGSNGFGSTGK